MQLSHKLNIGYWGYFSRESYRLFWRAKIYGLGKNASSTNFGTAENSIPISLCDNNRSLRFSVCMTSVVHSFLF